jgi:hypothetical protein
LSTTITLVWRRAAAAADDDIDELLVLSLLARQRRRRRRRVARTRQRRQLDSTAPLAGSGTLSYTLLLVVSLPLRSSSLSTTASLFDGCVTYGSSTRTLGGSNGLGGAM